MIPNCLTYFPQRFIIDFLPDYSSIIFHTKIQLTFLTLVQNGGNRKHHLEATHFFLLSFVKNSHSFSHKFQSPISISSRIDIT